ncbi:MAG: GldG family protein [Bryobacteraceae bacterium]
MASDWMKTRQTKYTLYVTVYLIVVIAILGAVNWLAQRHNKSIDSTSSKKFSLSDQTVKVVKGLTRDVTVNYYDKTSSFTTSRDLLDRYANLSTKLHVAYIDPDKKPQVAKAAGIRAYGSIVVDSGAKKEEAKSLTEEELTGALIRSLKSGDRNVCFVTGSGEKGLEDSGRSGYSSVKEALEKSNYKTRTISLLQKPEVEKDCTVLVVAGPRFEYTEAAVNAIKLYVEAGGRALFLIDPPLKLGKDENTGGEAISKILQGWGITLNKDLALDTSGIGQVFGLSEVVPLVVSYESHPIVRELKEVATAFPLSRTLEAKSEGKATAEKLFSTSDNSYATSNLASAEIRIDPKKDRKGPLTLGAAGSYKGGEKEGRFVVVGSSGFIANNLLRFNGNRDMFLNMMNWLSSDEDLISIRPKEPEDRRLSLSRRQMTTILSASVFGLPLLVIAGGLMVWWKRR